MHLFSAIAGTSDELQRNMTYIEQSASDLDIFTKELTDFIAKLEQKGEMKSV